MWKTQQEQYSKPRIPETTYSWVKNLTCEGCGIRAIGRLLKIGKSSVQNIIKRIASTIQLPIYHEDNQTYELDELRTYCGRKRNECWLMYGINKRTGKVINFKVGKRTKENIRQITEAILQFKPERIYTD